MKKTKLNYILKCQEINYIKKMSSKTLRTVTGTVYPAIVPGSGPRDKTLPIKTSDNSHYHNPRVKINESDYNRWNKLRNVPLIFEHGAEQKTFITVGNVVDTTIQKDDSIYIVANVHDTPEGAWAADQLENGTITGFSVGYDVTPDQYGQIQSKDIQEVSLVLKPFFPCATISVCASDSKVYNTTEKKESDLKHFVPLFHMDTELKNTPAATRNPADEVNKVAAELELKQLKEKQQQQEQELAALRAQQQELDRFRLEKKQQQEKEAASKTMELEEAMNKIKKGMGVDSLPEEYINDVRQTATASVFADPNDVNKKVLEVSASMTRKIADTMHNMQSDNEALKKQLDALKQEMLEKEKAFNTAADRINASRNAVFQAPPPPKDMTTEQQQPKVESVKASGSHLHGSHISDLLNIPAIRPNTREGDMYRQMYNPSFYDASSIGYGVQASGSTLSKEPDFVQIKSLPTHDRLHAVQNSMRFRVGEDGVRYGEAWQAHAQSLYAPNLQTHPSVKFSQTYALERSTK
jgi:hypothetical protein